MKRKDLTGLIYKKQAKGYYDVYLYYSKNKKQLYLPIGLRIAEKLYSTKNKTILSKNNPDYVFQLQTIKEKHEKFEALVQELFDEFKEKPDVEVIQFHLNKTAATIKEEKIKVYKDILDYYDEFLVFKEKAVENPKVSLSKYYNLRDGLIKFRELKNESLQFINLDEEFLFKYVTFLLTEKVDARRKKNVKVGLSNNSCLDGLKIFIQFLKWTVEVKEINFNIFLFETSLKFVKKRLKLVKTKTSHRVLSQRELEYFYNYQFLQPKVYENFSTSERFYYDFFLICCLQGPAFCDAKTIQRHNIEDGRIIDVRNKTGEDFDTALHPITKDILEKWNYDLTQYTEGGTVYKTNDGRYNIALKYIFRRFFTWYAPIHKKETGKEFQLEFKVKRKRGLEFDINAFNRWDQMTTHCGRATYITVNASNANSIADMKNLMESVGHVRSETTMGYVQKREDDTSNVISIKKFPKSITNSNTLAYK